MELLTESKSRKKIPIPKIGIESCEDSSSESWSECCDDRYCHIAECTYYKAQARGFESGHEMEGWLAVEAEMLQ